MKPKNLLSNKNRGILISGILSVVFFSNSYGFQNQIKLSSVYQKIIQSENDFLEISDAIIIDDLKIEVRLDSSNFIEKLSKLLKMDVPNDIQGIKSKVKHLYFHNIKGVNLYLSHLNIDTLTLLSVNFSKLHFYKLRSNELAFDSLKVTDILTIERSEIGLFIDQFNEYERYRLIENTFNGFYTSASIDISNEYFVIDCHFKKGANMAPDFIGTFNDFLLEGSVFDPITSALSFQNDSISPAPFIMRSQLRLNLFGTVHQAIIDSNVFKSDSIDQVMLFSGDIDYLRILNNRFESIPHLSTSVIRQLEFAGNSIERSIILSELILEAKNNLIKWDEFKGFRIAAYLNIASMIEEKPELFGYTFEETEQVFEQTLGYLTKPYLAVSDEDLSDIDNFQTLISTYYRLYKIFKENGQISEANQVYIEMKDVQLKELSYQYRTSGGIEAWINLQLNKLLRFYTDYGTNPSKAITISLVVLLLFAVFYFFFPSEWDTKSKKQLLTDYKHFIEKNEKGYIKPFFKLNIGLLNSLINAFTLSLNAFVTLGFGSIPTSGIARYVCILQGFLGWFLLSIFTASLINQVMF
ncbi:MAG: hypothetical protein ACJAZV_000939 [Roseivirga sp.]|jgi:hypothetical protein